MVHGCPRRKKKTGKHHHRLRLRQQSAIDRAHIHGSGAIRVQRHTAADKSNRQEEENHPFLLLLNGGTNQLESLMAENVSTFGRAAFSTPRQNAIYFPTFRG